MIWIYKCNARNEPHQSTYGDWKDFFRDGETSDWGSTESVPALRRASVGDRIIAYQTDRNELVGMAQVVGWRRRGKYEDIILKPLVRLGVKVRPLKKRYPRVARIPALRPGPIRTLYEIPPADAKLLLKARTQN
jgi:hypothetical protein